VSVADLRDRFLRRLRTDPTKSAEFAPGAATAELDVDVVF